MDAFIEKLNDVERLYLRLRKNLNDLLLNCLHSCKECKSPFNVDEMQYFPSDVRAAFAHSADSDVLSVTRELLDLGADPNAQNRMGRPALHEAIIFSSEEVVQELLSRGADVNSYTRLLFNSLHIAVLFNRYSMIKILIEHGADLNARNFSADTAVHHCVAKNDVRMLKELLKFNIDVDLANFTGKTPLQFAIKHSKVEIIKLLLKAGASTKMRGSRSLNALHFALQITKPNLEVIIELLKHGAGIYSFDDNLKFALEYALMKDSQDPSKSYVLSKTLIKWDTLLNTPESIDRLLKKVNACYEGKYFLQKFIIECIVEIEQMKVESIQGISIFEFVNKGLGCRERFSENTACKVLTIDQMVRISRNFPIYGDVIAAHLDKTHLQESAMDLKVYTVREYKEEQEQIVLHSYSIDAISEYLSNIDLLNLIIAFSKEKIEPDENLGFKMHGFGMSKKRRLSE